MNDGRGEAQRTRRKPAGKGCIRSPTSRPIRRAQDGAPGGFGLAEENRQRQKQKQKQVLRLAPYDYAQGIAQDALPEVDGHG